MTTISQERAALARVGHSLRTREQARFKFDYTTSRPVDEPATRVFVHITITNPKSYTSDDAHARAVESIGISRFPATGVSYNRLIMQSGAAYEGQPIGRRGAHTVNDRLRATCTTPGCPGKGGPLTAPSWNLNVNSRAYAICQNVNDTVTDKQLDSLARSIAADMLAGFVRKDAEIHGHRCVANKDCPAAKMWARMGELRRLVDHYLKVGFKPPVPPKPPVEDDVTPAQMTELKNHITAEVRRFSIWELRWLTQTEDERAVARARYDAAVAAGMTPAAAATMLIAELAPLDDSLEQTQQGG